MKVEDILEKLEKKGRPDQLDSMARYGIVGEKRFGVSMPDLKILAREIGKDHNLALDLWKTGFQDARLLAAMIDCPEAVIETQMEEWVKDFDSWDVCDGVISYLFEKVPYAKKKIFDWAVRKEEFVKRAAFSLIAIIAIRDKKAPDIDFIRFIEIQGADIQQSVTVQIGDSDIGRVPCED